MEYKESYSGTGLPALLKNHEDGTVSFVSNGPLSVGDTYETNRFNERLGKTVKNVLMIHEIIESRPAKGDWSGQTWGNTNPVWTLTRCL